MKRRVLLSMLVSLLAVGSAIAHHGYNEYDRSQLVALEGTLTRVQWSNPHVLLILQTESKGEYTVEWGSVVQLVRQGIKPVPLRAGDHLIITGSVNKNPDKKILTLLTEISRPADGWRWESPGRSRSTSTNK
jgi:Family of unknown function (DUF6152)